MARVMTLLGGLGLGLGLMYLLDPSRGEIRRTRIRRRANQSARDLGHLIERTRAIGDRTRVALAKGRDRVSGRGLAAGAAGIVGMTAAAYATRALVGRRRLASESADREVVPMPAMDGRDAK